MRKYNHMITRFVIYGLLGWNMEILWTGLSSVTDGSFNLIGHTSVWMFFVYGSAVFALEPIHPKISHLNWFYRGCIWTVLIFLIEFISGMLLKLIGIEAWHYSCPLSVCGVIRLDYAPLLFVVGLLLEKAHSMLLLLNKTQKG